MADKVIKSFALKDLKCSLPESGQYPEKETGTSGKEYIGLPKYEYEPLKESLQEKGYVPEEFDYIVATSSGEILYGGRRVWLMQKDMGMNQDTMIDCEIMEKQDFYDEMKARMLANVNPNLLRRKDKDGKTIMPTARVKPKQYFEQHKGYQNLRKLGKKRGWKKPYNLDHFVLSNGLTLKQQRDILDKED
tara:strand:- start:2724 stop:3293 length:570 start_codon:yes stop_codon:yes gene_type:complete